MPPQSRIGPFALEAPLGKRSSSGQVFRAIHVEQRKLAAIRVFSIPMGLTPESRQEFSSQLVQLKQLRHNGIVRCYGGGFDSRNAYLAYELIDGESLETIVRRRGCLSWETAQDYGQSLAEALQYGHQMGWIHARLRPDKIVISNDGATVKISDWRKSMIASTIGNAPPQLNEAQFLAPEQFDSGLKPDEKTDLYGLGAVLYYMLTGKPPFSADRMDQLIRQIRTEAPPSVATAVFDCPVWLSAIVEQLLVKDPRQRPFGAAAVQLAFKEARRRQAQGVGVLQHATAGFSPLQLKANRDEAEKMMAAKPKKKRKRVDTPFYERTWVLLFGLVACIGSIVWLMLPLGERALRERAERLLANGDSLDWQGARGFLDELVENYPTAENVQWAQERIDVIEMRSAERRMERNVRLGNRHTEVEQLYLKAQEFEQFGDRATALDKYRGIVDLFGGQEEHRPIINLARLQMQKIKDASATATGLQEFLVTQMKHADAAYTEGKTLEAKKIWEGVVSLYRGNQDMAPFVEQAERRLDALREPTRKSKS